MSEKKVVRRNVAIALGIACIILAAGIGGAMAYYTTKVNAITNERDTIYSDYSNYVSTHNHNDSEYDNVSAQKDALQTQKDALQTQKDALQNEVNNFDSPRLIKVNFGADDTRIIFTTPHLHIYGIIFNTRSGTAYNCKLHVELYRGQTKVADEYVGIGGGTIYGESSTSVDINVYYDGDALTTNSITPQWTS